jgi:hypothetical protein
VRLHADSARDILQAKEPTTIRSLDINAEDKTNKAIWVVYVISEQYFSSLHDIEACQSTEELRYSNRKAPQTSRFKPFQMFEMSVSFLRCFPFLGLLSTSLAHRVISTRPYHGSHVWAVWPVLHRMIYHLPSVSCVGKRTDVLDLVCHRSGRRCRSACRRWEACLKDGHQGCSMSKSVVVYWR